MTLPSGPIESALITRYRGDATLQGLLTGSTSPTWSIFDANGVPTNQPFPYVVVYIITEQLGTAFTTGRDGVDSYIQVSPFAQSGAGGGIKQIRDIDARLYDLTHKQMLDLSAYGLNNFFLLFVDKQELTDGTVQQGPMRFHAMTQG